MPESPKVEIVPAPSPLLLLIGNVAAAVARSRAMADKPVKVQRVDTTPDGLAFAVEAQGINFLVDGPYRVELEVLRTTRESTLCDVRVAEGRMVGRLFNWGLKLIPNALLNGMLKGQAGGSIQIEG